MSDECTIRSSLIVHLELTARRGAQGRRIVRFAGNLLDVFGVFDLPILADDEHGTRVEACKRAVLYLDAVAPGKRLLAKVRQHFDSVDAGCPAPALLGERKVHTNRP